MASAWCIYRLIHTGKKSRGGVKHWRFRERIKNATLENEYAIRKFLSIKGLSVSRNDGSVCDTMELLPSACFIVDFRKEQGAGTFVFTGGGYGHGVGMSQNGAKASCRKWSWLAGHSADFLSEYYYRKLCKNTEK